MRRSDVSRFVRAGLRLGVLGSLAACSFSEGPDWPPLSDPKETRRQLVAHAPKIAAEEERSSLADLVAGEPLPPPPGGGAALVGQRPPLAVIRFGAAPVAYEDALYDAVRGALERRPASAFELVAVTPYVGAEEQTAFAGRLERVYRDLIAMGLPAERLSLSSLSQPGVQVDEVHVYVR